MAASFQHGLEWNHNVGIQRSAGADRRDSRRGAPWAPGSRQTVAEIAEAAATEARTYAAAGFHGLLIENTHGRPYLRRSFGPEVVAAMAVIGLEVRRGGRAAAGRSDSRRRKFGCNGCGACLWSSLRAR